MSTHFIYCFSTGCFSTSVNIIRYSITIRVFCESEHPFSSTVSPLGVTAQVSISSVTPSLSESFVSQNIHFHLLFLHWVLRHKCQYHPLLHHYQSFCGQNIHFHLLFLHWVFQNKCQYHPLLHHYRSLFVVKHPFSSTVSPLGVSTQVSISSGTPSLSESFCESEHHFHLLFPWVFQHNHQHHH